MITCQKCNGLSTIPIVYGKPSVELERAAARGLVEISGSGVESGSPTMRCLECRHAWRRADDGASDAAAADKLARVREIVSTYLFPIHTGMVSSELFTDSQHASASSFKAIYAYVQLKEILGIRHGCTLEQVASVHAFKKTNSALYKQIINELKQQVFRQSPNGQEYGNLYDKLFRACALVFNASPISKKQGWDQESMDHFLELIRMGIFGFE